MVKVRGLAGGENTDHLFRITTFYTNTTFLSDVYRVRGTGITTTINERHNLSFFNFLKEVGGRQE